MHCVLHIALEWKRISITKHILTFYTSFSIVTVIQESTCFYIEKHCLFIALLYFKVQNITETKDINS